MSIIKSDLGVTRQCNHFCKNKDLCGHDCCESTVSLFMHIFSKLRFVFYQYWCTVRHLEISCIPLYQGKVGVAVGRKRSSNQESSFSSHLKDLQSRYNSLSQTPVKKLKVRQNEWNIYNKALFDKSCMDLQTLSKSFLLLDKNESRVWIPRRTGVCFQTQRQTTFRFDTVKQSLKHMDANWTI